MSKNTERQADLVSYLPPFVAEYGEINEVLTAANPEFKLLWDSKERVLKNQFILTADSYGLSRFESLLGIIPSRLDTLESRRHRVMSRWFLRLPYTERMFLEKLKIICSDCDFIFEKYYGEYKIKMTVHLEMFGRLEELERLIYQMLPCNMIILAKNEIICKVSGEIGYYATAAAGEFFRITEDIKESHVLTAKIGAAGGVNPCEDIRAAGITEAVDTANLE